jgi:hypothetical protein
MICRRMGSPQERGGGKKENGCGRRIYNFAVETVDFI